MVRPTGSPIIHQNNVRSRRLQAYIGMLANKGGLHLERNYVNEDPQAQQVSTLTVDAYSAVNYTFTFNGVDYTVLGAGGTTTTVATQLRLLMEDEGAIYGHVTIVQATNVLTLTAREPGFSFTLTDADAQLTSATTTAAADAATVAFGAALSRTGFATGTAADVEGSIERAALSAVGLFTAQVDTWTVADPGTGNDILATLEIKGLPEKLAMNVAWDTALDGTLDDLAVVLNAALVDLGYDAYVTVAGPAGSPGAGELEFTAAIAGVEFTSWVGCNDDAGYPAITVVSNKDFDTSFIRSFAGMAKRASDEEAALDMDSSSTAVYAANATMLVVESGDVWVNNSDTLGLGEQVFVDLTAAAGTFHNAAGTNRVPLPRERAEWIKSARSIENETLGLLRLK